MTPSKTDPRPPRDFPDPPDEEPWDGPVPMDPPDPSKTDRFDELEELLPPGKRDPEIGHVIRTFGNSIEDIGLREISEDRPLTDNELRAAAFLARQVVAHVYGDQTLVLPALLAERKRLLYALDLLREITNSGVAFEIPGRYHEVQISSRTWDMIREVAARLQPDSREGE